jgi:hypothetical protein
MFHRKTTGRVPGWLKVVATLVTLALAFLSVAADFAPFLAVSSAAHRVYFAAVILPPLSAIIRLESVLLASSLLALHENIHRELIDLTCCRLC